MSLKDDRVLFSMWLKDPVRIGAVLPSGGPLCRAVAAQIDPARPGAVVELGAGTGAVTRALLERGVAPSSLVVIEYNEGLCRLLRERFPQATVIAGDARRARALLAGKGITAVNTVVSSLPLRNLAPRPVATVLRQAFDIMDRDGTFVQYTYRATAPVPRRLLRRLGLHARLADHVWINVPPATVWRFTRERAGLRGRARPGAGIGEEARPFEM